MFKPWSISTTVRSPDRLRGFLSVLAGMEGMEWRSAQSEFQIRLIQSRLYGAHTAQFYNGLSQQHIDLIENEKEISLAQARAIFCSKNYNDPGMRGRQSFKALGRFGFASASNGNIFITDMGKMLLAETKDYGEIFLRALLKWQLPNNLDRHFQKGYNIKPFVGVLRLIAAVNNLSAKQNDKEKGLSFEEFKIFAITLINSQNIDKTAGEIIQFRQDLNRTPVNERHVFIENSAARLRPNFEMANRQDYADNAIRYFRMTKYVRLRGWGSYIDLEPARKNELATLFNNDNASAISDFTNLGGSYFNYLASDKMPDLPGQSVHELKAIIQFIQSEIEVNFEKKEAIYMEKLSHSELIKLCDKLRNQYQTLIRNKNKSEIRNPDKAQECVAELRLLAKRKKKDEMRPSVKLEWLTTQALDIFNDAEKICPNYPVGDDGVPTFTAPGGMADIECYYDKFAAICEVTMLSGCKQWIHEAQPIMRHLSEFGKKHKNKEVYCLFIAPKMHQDSLHMFQFSAERGYEGEKQRIVPLNILEFCDILDFCIERMRAGRNLNSKKVKELLDLLADSVCNIKSADKWRRNVPNLIETWKNNT